MSYHTTYRLDQINLDEPPADSLIRELHRFIFLNQKTAAFLPLNDMDCLAFAIRVSFKGWEYQKIGKRSIPFTEWVDRLKKGTIAEIEDPHMRQFMLQVIDRLVVEAYDEFGDLKIPN